MHNLIINVAVCITPYLTSRKKPQERNDNQPLEVIQMPQASHSIDAAMGMMKFCARHTYVTSVIIKHSKSL